MDPREALLETLRDPHPPLVGGWPPAIGWWLVAALLAIGVAALVVFLRRRRARRHRALAWQRAARTELAALRARLDPGSSAGRSSELSAELGAEILVDASVLARRTLLAVRPRADVAGLNGRAWLEALDAASGGTRFTTGPARALASAPFERAPAVSHDAAAEVVDALDELVTALGRPRPGERSDASRTGVSASRTAAGGTPG